MLKNYLLVAVRHLKRQPGYALVNILGLTIGLASCLLIILYLSYELSYDNYHEKAGRVYRISSNISEPDDAFKWAVTQLPLGRTVTDEFAEVDQYVRYIPSGRTRFQKGDIAYFIEDTYLVDSTVFEVFSYEFLSGDPLTALNEPNSIVLSKSESDKIFKGENPIGQLLESENHSYKVTGVYKDQPLNSHIRAGAMASASTAQNFYSSQNWGGFNIFTYVLLNDQADEDFVETKLNQEIIKKYVAVIFDQYGVNVEYKLLNIRDIHLTSDFEGEPMPLGNISYIYIFSIVAAFLVLIACINYMNLATARSMRRSLEVGIRKVMGAYKTTLISQFMIESMLIAIVATLFSLIILVIATPAINNVMGTNLDLMVLVSPGVLFLILGVLVITGVLSGSYPAFYLSAFKPVDAIRGGAGKRSGRIWLRRFLVGLQFAITIFMLISTLIVFDQMQYVRKANLGFNKDQVITFRLNRAGTEKWPVLRNKLLENPSIISAGTGGSVPGRGYGKNLIQVETNEGVMDEYGINLFTVDYDYFKTLEVDVVTGRDISSEYTSDTVSAVIVNEAMVSRLNWDNPIGKRFQFDRDSTLFHRVVGVVRDYHHQSLYNPIEPLMFIPNLNNRNALIRISSGNIEDALSHIENSWNEFFPNTPYEYEFLNQEFLREYEGDQLRGNLFLGFSIMMIVIASLGLLGLASFIAEQRSKEISIRKVLGANVQYLVSLLVKEFVWLVILGAIPAFIIGYYFMDNWLQNFEFHVDINLILFAIVLVFILVITLFTTGFHAYKAAITNPSDNLKYE